MNTLQRYDFIIKDRFRFHRLGDTSMHVTGNIYSHVTQKMENKAYIILVQAVYSFWSI